MTSTFLTLALLLPAAPVPAPKDTPPKGPPPRIVAVTIDAEGGFQLTETRIQYVPQQRERVVLVGGQTQKVTETVTVPVQEMVLRKVGGDSVEVYGIDGKKIAPEDVRKLDRRTLPALVSADGKPVDPFYLRVAREGTLVLVISAKETNPPRGIAIPAPKADLPPAPPRPKEKD